MTQTPRTSSPLQLVAKNVGGRACRSRGVDSLDERDEAEAEEGGGQQVLAPALLDLLQYFTCIYIGQRGV